MRVAPGAKTYATVAAALVHRPKQRGHVSSSPITRVMPSPRGCSLTSSGGASASTSVNGARTTRVTFSRVKRRLSRVLASPSRIVSESGMRRGSPPRDVTALTNDTPVKARKVLIKTA